MSEYLITPIQTIQINLSNTTSCVPVEKIVAALPYLTEKQTALNLGIITFFAGMAIAFMISYVWWRRGK